MKYVPPTEHYRKVKGTVQSGSVVVSKPVANIELKKSNEKPKEVIMMERPRD